MAISIDKIDKRSGYNIVEAIDRYERKLRSELISKEQRNDLVNAGNKVQIGEEIGTVIDYNNNLINAFDTSTIKSLEEAIKLFCDIQDVEEIEENKVVK